jgi:putative ABC transport system substrate-binding protein
VPGTELTLRAIEQASRDTPIVFVANDYDPLASGHVAQLAHPGGRVTGVSPFQSELPAKRLEVLKELLPKLRRLGVLADVSTVDQLKVTRTAAARLGIELLVQEFSRTPYDYPGAFAAFGRGKAEALLALTSGLFVPARRMITGLALKHRLPSLFNNELWIESGGLLSYGPSFPATYRQAAEQVAKVLNGVKPGDIPVEQPNVVEMAINLKTAKALGLTIPPAIRLRADRVIE